MNIIDLINAVTPEQLDVWTDIRMVGRGYGMVEEVSQVVASDECISARVRGGSLYVTSVFADSGGEIDSRCTCPVRKRCKHAVALILAVQRKHKAGETISMLGISERMDARLLVMAAEEAERRAEEERRLAALREAERKEAARQEEIRNLKAGFEELRKEVQSACERHDPLAICEAVEDFLVWSDDEESDLYYPGEFDYVPYIVELTMESVIVALRESGWTASDLLVWACGLTRPYHFFSPGKVIELLWEFPSGEYEAPDVWAEVAEKLEEGLKKIPPDESSGVHSDWLHQLHAIHTAWYRAGSEERCLRPFVEYVGKAGNWSETVRLLNRFERYDEAARIGREAIRAFVASGECDFEDECNESLVEPFAMACFGNGDLPASPVVNPEMIDRAWDLMEEFRQREKNLQMQRLRDPDQICYTNLRHER